MTLLLGTLVLASTVLAEMWQMGSIGIAISAKNDNEPARVARVFAGSPAEFAGIKTNWCLISVDGSNVVNLSSAQCMSMIHGPVGTPVTLELVDSFLNQTNKITVKRADVKIPAEALRP